MSLLCFYPLRSKSTHQCAKTHTAILLKSKWALISRGTENDGSLMNRTPGGCEDSWGRSREPSSGQARGTPRSGRSEEPPGWSHSWWTARPSQGTPAAPRWPWSWDPLTGLLMLLGGHLTGWKWLMYVLQIRFLTYVNQFCFNWPRCNISSKFLNFGSK